MKKYLLLAAGSLCLVVAGCFGGMESGNDGNGEMGYPKTPYTSGNVSLTLKKGKTTKDEVLKAFGAPNIVTQDAEGDSVWTYQTNATVTRNSENQNYWTVLLAGGNYQNGGFMRSQKTMTIIITFKNNIVSNFKSLSTSF